CECHQQPCAPVSAELRKLSNPGTSNGLRPAACIQLKPVVLRECFGFVGPSEKAVFAQRFAMSVEELPGERQVVEIGDAAGKAAARLRPCAASGSALKPRSDESATTACATTCHSSRHSRRKRYAAPTADTYGGESGRSSECFAAPF